MKIFLIILAIVVVTLAVVALVNYLLQKRRQERAQREGVVVYSTVVSVSDVGGWAKQLAMKKIVLRLKEPDAASAREITLRSRVTPGQRIIPGLRLAVVIDPKNPKRVYPASPEAAERVQLTGSREERRQMKAQRAGVRRRTQVIRRPSGREPWS